MNRNNVWRFTIVMIVLLWSLYEIYPPKPRDLVQVFREKAQNRDATFTEIMKKAVELQRASPEKSYDDLREAIGTNDITKYFPYFNAKESRPPTQFILNRIQREAAGKIKLGLDLQGGTSVLVRMNTNNLTKADTGAVLSQAVEVLRKRVDKLGVAEPLIQPQGTDRILVQLPGLSAADQESALISIKKAAFLEFRMVHPQSDELIKQGA